MRRFSDVEKVQMKKINILSIVAMLIMVILVHGTVGIKKMFSKEKDKIKVGFLYVGDSCDTYTNNFIRGQKAIEVEFGDSVEIVAKYNVAEGMEEKYLRELVAEKCDLIFSTSYGYGVTTKKIAEEYPEIEFCMATCSDANELPILDNYHNFMGEIYQGRYISGVVAGMKLAEMIDNGEITIEQAKIGYVGAFPYPEVISGYTAFYLGVHSIVPEVTMNVIYTNSWGDYILEKQTTERLIKEGCVIISQHSDTTGPAVACEELSNTYKTYHIGYNQSMTDVAPTTSLISSRINWQYYMVSATEAVLKGKKIESVVNGNKHGNDVGGGIRENWVQMLKLNDTVAAKGTQSKIDSLTQRFIDGKISVFKGNFIGVDPYDENDTYDLSIEYKENRNTSAPTFHYVLKDVIVIED